MSHEADGDGAAGAGPDRDPRPLVLVAEDEPIASMALRAQLEALDLRVLGPARNGDEAVHLGACYPVDIGLFDVNMPGRSGLDAAFDLFALAPTPVVLLTGVGTADLPDPVPEPPVFGLLTKPVDLAELGTGLQHARDRFRRWIRSSDAHRPSIDEITARRTTISRAVTALAAGERPALAAARLLRRAADEGRDPEEVARDILDEPRP